MKKTLFFRLFIALTFIPSLFFAQHKKSFCLSCDIIQGKKSVALHYIIQKESYSAYKEVIHNNIHSLFAELNEKLKAIHAITHTSSTEETQDSYHIYTQTTNNNASVLTWQYVLRILRNTHHAVHLLFTEYSIEPITNIQIN